MQSQTTQSGICSLLCGNIYDKEMSLEGEDETFSAMTAWAARILSMILLLICVHIKTSTDAHMYIVLRT